MDRSPLIAPNYFKVVFFRDRQQTAHVPLRKWVWYGCLEVFFGEELLESLVTTASLSGSPDAEDPKGEFGWPLQLGLHIPAGIFSNLFRRHLVELLYYKFYCQYQLIQPTPGVYAEDSGAHLDVTRVRFRLRKSLLYQLIAFRRVYIAEALVLNVAIDAVVFAASQCLTTALVAAAVVEGMRRLMKL
ncbi:hypothetical protein [Giesbergeria sp.]|uniref:hypothetical protein n=1 Tax=Giesbergeria sp. TaxID=2818473 RepID=UPI002606BE84|nr:hypothetical protein [Giesbergeria sp.]